MHYDSKKETEKKHSIALNHILNVDVSHFEVKIMVETPGVKESQDSRFWQKCLISGQGHVKSQVGQ